METSPSWIKASKLAMIIECFIDAHPNLSGLRFSGFTFVASSRIRAPLERPS